MTVMIYNKKKITPDEDYNQMTTHSRFLFTDDETMCEQLAELIGNMLHREDAYTWNCAGDEYVVDPSYAEGCMWQSILESEEVRKLLNMFGTSLFYDLPRMNYDFDKQKDIPITSHKLFGKKEQKAAQEELPKWKAIISDLPTLLKQSIGIPVGRFSGGSPRWRDLHFKWDDCKYYGGYIHEVHILTGFTQDAFNLDDFKAVNKTADAYEKEKQAKEEEEYYASEQYKKDRQEEAERMAELQTAMGEGGYTCYADNGDGTYSMWR